MSTHATTAESAQAHDQQGHVTVQTLFTIYGALIGLMFLTYGAALFDLGHANFPIAIGIAGVKMGLIVFYFMHARYSPKLIWIASVGALLWLLILAGGLLSDYFTRGAINVPGK